ncbi:MAG: MEDS domain-containing protein [Gemmatimonadaceae bacterium]
MDRKRERQSGLNVKADGARNEPWDRVVADAAPGEHIVQLYQDQDFLNRAVCRFAGAAIANGEGLILVPTLTHWNAFRPRLEAEGVDVEAARERGQLTIVDADECLPRFMRDGMPDSPVFLGLAADVIGRARAGGRYQKVRWWGEMVNVLWEQGNVAASMSLEDLFDQLGEEQDVALFCSFLMDNFDGEVHTHMLPRLGTNHSHLIPVEDYAHLERAVADALRETVGAQEARALESRLLSEYRQPFDMPPAQALLLALRQVVPTVANPVLQRTRELYTAASGAGG